MRIVETVKASAQAIMDKDEQLLHELGSEPILHLYEWANPSFTYGYFIDIEKFVDLAKAKEKGIDYARRPTGGGIIFHLWDLAFSFLLPSSHPAYKMTTLENYRFVNQVVLNVVEKFLKPSESFDLIGEDVDASDLAVTKFCMARPTKYDVMFEGRKIAGASQRKRANGYLHQGTISLVPPDEKVLSELLLNSKVTESILRYSMAPLEEKAHLAETREVFRNLLANELKEALSSTLAK